MPRGLSDRAKAKEKELRREHTTTAVPEAHFPLFSLESILNNYGALDHNWNRRRNPYRKSGYC
jgi:hypothetical protein